MSNDSVEKHVNKYYMVQHLNSSVATRLKSISESSVEDETPVVPLARWPWKKIGIASSFLLLVMIVTQVLYTTYSYHDALVMRIVQEVELNHKKQFKSDFVSTDIQALAVAMNKLEFKLKLPTQMKNTGYQVTGARYCSIQGEIAAQLKLREDTGAVATLYVTKLNNQFIAIPQQSQVRDELSIELWQEAGLFYSLVRVAE